MVCGWNPGKLNLSMTKTKRADGGRLNAYRHGHTNPATPTYRTWRNMLTRCQNPKHNAYPKYGGRGIVVCERWQQFEHFLEDMGVRPSGLTLERKDMDGGYEPSNCCWATRQEQNNNTHRNRRITFQGETMTVTEWANRMGLHYKTVTQRLDRGVSVEIALTAKSNRRRLL